MVLYGSYNLGQELQSEIATVLKDNEIEWAATHPSFFSRYTYMFSIQSWNDIKYYTNILKQAREMLTLYYLQLLREEQIVTIFSPEKF